MKRTHLLFVFLSMLLLTMNEKGDAQTRFGIGFIFGEPTGVSWKLRLDPDNALDGAVGWSPFDRLRLHADYLWESHPFNDANAHIYYGIGGALGFGQSEYVGRSGRFLFFAKTGEGDFGVRLPIGFNYSIPRSPVEIFLEVAPVLVLTPVSGLGVDGGIGARFYP